MNHLLYGHEHPSEIEERAYCPLCMHEADVAEFDTVGYKCNTGKAVVFRCPECEQLFDLEDLSGDKENYEHFNN